MDQFYTKPKVAKKCVKLFKETVSICDADIIIEPSAGTGSFMKPINTLVGKHIFYDIDPKKDGIIRQDFLEVDTKFDTKDGKIHMIGNPPFGKQSSLAKKFIKKACEFCDTISFILPKSFKKESMNKCFEKHFHWIVNMDLPDNSFIKDGEECSVLTCFQIWIRTSKVRKLSKPLKPNGYKFVEKTEADVSFRRVGFYAGNTEKDCEKSSQSHYFIKFNSGDVDEIIKKMNEFVFERDNTVGARSISKQELIKKLNQIM